jgi:hypothetical protein
MLMENILLKRLAMKKLVKILKLLVTEKNIYSLKKIRSTPKVLIDLERAPTKTPKKCSI